MELLLICGLLVMLFINIAWFVCLSETVKAMSSIHEVVQANAELTLTIGNEMLKDKMKENTRLKESIENGTRE